MIEKFRGMGSILSEHRRFSMGTRKDRNYLKRCRGAWLFTISDHIFCVNSTFFISPFQSLQQCTVAPHSPNRHALHYYYIGEISTDMYALFSTLQKNCIPEGSTMEVTEKIKGKELWSATFQDLVLNKNHKCSISSKHLFVY